MSDLVLPNFIGFAMERKRNPAFDTRIQKTARGLKEIRAHFDPYPLWHFTVPIAFLANDLEANELDELLGFYLAHNGRTDTWLYDCPRYNYVDNVSIGVGDGETTAFQLRIIHPHGFIEPVNSPNLSWIDIYVDGELALPTERAVSATGLITTATPPAAGAVITWTGNYYHRCRFDADMPQFNESSVGEFDDADFSFIGSPVNIL